LGFFESPHQACVLLVGGIALIALTALRQRRMH